MGWEFWVGKMVEKVLEHENQGSFWKICAHGCFGNIFMAVELLSLRCI